MIHMNEKVDDSIPFIGVDDSKDMLDKCRNKLLQLDIKRPFELVVADLNTEYR